jgi:hypothetical protein
MVGPALPQVLRAVRYPLYDPDGNFSDTDKDDPDTMATTCPEEHGPSVIISEEKKKIGEVVDDLEDIFSLTCVASPYPRHSLYFLLSYYIQGERPDLTKNILTPEESWRFRRAVYRIWLYTSIFPGDCYEIDLIQRQRKAILDEYPTDDLCQLYAVVRFFRGILEDVSDEENNNREFCSLTQAQALRQLIYYAERKISTSFCLWGRAVLQAHGKIAHTNSAKRLSLYNGYFSLPLENIWTAREVEPPEDDEPAMQWILYTINGTNDTCAPISINYAKASL